KQKKPNRLMTAKTRPKPIKNTTKPISSIKLNGLKTFAYSSAFTKKLTTNPATPPISNVFKNIPTNLRLFNMYPPTIYNTCLSCVNNLLYKKCIMYINVTLYFSTNKYFFPQRSEYFFILTLILKI